MAIFLHNQQQCELQHTPLICGGRQAREGDHDANNGCFLQVGVFQMVVKKVKIYVYVAL